MRKLRNLIGMPVVMGEKKIGRVIQAEVTEDLKSLSCIWMDAGLRGTRRISVENLEMIGEMSVITDSPGQRMRCKSSFPVFRAVSTGGRRLGAVTGVEIDELSFLVSALELSGGFWDDLYLGRQRVERFRVDSPGGAVIIQDSAKENIGEDEL